MPRRKMAGWPRLMETSGAARLCSTPYTTTTSTLHYDILLTLNKIRIRIDSKIW